MFDRRDFELLLVVASRRGDDHLKGCVYGEIDFVFRNMVFEEDGDPTRPGATGYLFVARCIAERTTVEQNGCSIGLTRYSQTNRFPSCRDNVVLRCLCHTQARALSRTIRCCCLFLQCARLDCLVGIGRLFSFVVAVGEIDDQKDNCSNRYERNSQPSLLSVRARPTEITDGGHILRLGTLRGVV